MQDIRLFTIERKTLFKNWIRKRFISELDVDGMTPEDVQAWGEAFLEMGAYFIAQADARGTGR